MYYIEDELIARKLQQKINSYEVDSPKKYGKENVKLTDSILEYHDPTPNIHDLFVKFDRKFFWSKLGMVEVKWSNRMTTCAGLCYYQGKRGLCSIKLSAPLLSLRPRKDLVETLLHEMIHAFLFVTHNNKDRDDHGPEFHKHMHRINKEAGTKITVYHSFLDEVAYYQKHIWRCNGPCQSRRPYFGFVKRAMNRAPGPNDTWWKEHQNNCGGTFIKVAGPEKVCKKKEKDKHSKHTSGVKDIRNFFQTSPVVSPQSGYNNHTTTKMPHIHTLKDLNDATSPSNHHTIKNMNQTYIVAPKTDIPKPQARPIKNDVKNVGDDTCKDSDKELLRVKATVRNAWANKYLSPSETLKKPRPKTPDPPQEITIEMKRRQVTCPVCNLHFSETIINEHVDKCLSTQGSSQSSQGTQSVDEIIVIDSKKDTVPQGQNHADVQIIGEKDSSSTLTECPVCCSPLDQCDLNEHLEGCLEHMFDNEDIEENEPDCDNVPCPCCMKWVSEKNINEHIDECLTFIALKNSKIT